MTTGPRSFASERLAESHRLGSFDCGHPELNEWIRLSAHHADAMGTGRTYVWCSAGPEVVAYYTLAAHLVTKTETPKRAARGSANLIPSVLIARLALDVRLQGEGWGTALLMDALHTAVGGARTVGARLIVVDAIDAEAAGYYEHHGFGRSSDALRLMRKASDAAHALGISWP